MSKHGSHIDLPALSADDSVHSSSYITDTSINDSNKTLQTPSIKNYNQQLNTDIQLQQQQQSNAFMNQPYFYNLDQMNTDNSLYFMQQQQQQQQNTLIDHFMKNSNSNNHSNNASSSSLQNNPNSALSISTSIESFQNAVSTTVGDQPPSFWAGLNNFISNVTHTNLFPTIPNIARSFSEYLANHPVPFLSSFNATNTSPTSSPLAGNSMDFERLMQFKQEHEHINTGMQIRVLGVPQTGAKSRVETQIKLCIQLVTDGGDKALWWSHLKLPEHMVTKDKLKRPGNKKGGNSIAGADIPVNPEKMLYLNAKVLCASDSSKKVVTCLGCVQRERKRSQRRKENKQNQVADETEDEKIDEDQSSISEEERILLFNCSEVVDFSAGDTILPTRITCYCRHHNEKIGFCIYFEMSDHTGKKVAEGISPPIMITDDHKSNKVKTGSKRRRTESEILPEPRIPALSWIKSSLPLPFSGKSENDNSNNYSNNSSNFPISSASSATSDIEDMKSALKSMLMPAFLQQSQPPVYPSSSQQQQQFPQTSLPPTMKRLIPNEAPTNGGIEITILGSNFRPGMTVMFGDSPATNMQYWSPNTLICTLPPAQHPGAVVVSFKESPPTDKSDVMVFTYLMETDRALMELALQVIGMKMTGIVEDARKIAMRIVQGNNNNNNGNSGALFPSASISTKENTDKLMTKSEQPSLK